MPGSAPCQAPLVCNEALDRCDADDCTEPDRDNDGDRRIACGGSDCDDDDRDRSGRAIEICDAANRDEDCNSNTVGPDIDTDGFEESACCNQVDGELRCGGDCDDGDPLTNPSRTEMCNGQDDDCSGAIDDVFDCPRSGVVSGLNACGREGERRCSDTCTWLDSGYYLAESRTTCDYCADSVAGLADETSFATATLPITRPSVLLGAAFQDASLRTWLAMSGQIGGATRDDGSRPYVVGYPRSSIRFDVTVDVTVRGANPGGGWAVGVYRHDPAAPRLSTSTTLRGLPDRREGLAAVVEFNGTAADSVYFYRVNSSSDPSRLEDVTGRLLPTAERVTGPSGTVRQVVGIGINADLPAVGDDTTLAEVLNGSGTRLHVCVNSAGSSELCGMTFVPGEEVEIIVSAAPSNADVQLINVAGLASNLCP
ncbi:MAG: putative metal-binding motif-containing protein [Sandaracinaceae bacterium]|nr:putative metal-binding motif-containing protein [Sandaracinaceae bacterium]